MTLLIWHFLLLHFFFIINIVLVIWIVILLHYKLSHWVTPCKFTLMKIQMIIVFFNCYWLLFEYFQSIILIFYLKFFIYLLLILNFDIKTLVVFICNCDLDIFQLWRLNYKCLIVFIIQNFVVIIRWNNLALWF